MTLYLSNRDGNGKTNEEGHYKLQTAMWSGQILESTSLQVTQNSPTGMSVLIAPGNFKIDSGSGYSYTGWNSTSTAQTITTADPANPRITCIVVYVDKGATTSASPPNNPGIIKFIAVNGTPAAVPSAPSAGTIQTAVGAGNPYIIIANVTVGTGVTTIVNANISDQRVVMSLAYPLVGSTGIQTGAVTTAKFAAGAVDTTALGTNAVTTVKIADDQVTTAKIPNRTRFVMFDTRADGSGGAVDGNNEGSPETAFTGTPTGYMRGRLIVPNDYVSGTTAILHVVSRATNTANHTTIHYVGARSSATGTAWSAWNVASNISTTNVSFTANQMRDHSVLTIPAANLSTGGNIMFAYRISTAITGTIYSVAAYLEYTADS